MTFSEPSRVGTATSFQPSPYEPQDSMYAYESTRALRMDLADAVACLPERQQMILSLYFREKLKLREIGEVLDMPELRVSRLHATALSKVGSVSWALGEGDPHVR
jgi:RNA polymerase sigma factor (sigma-70 family)